MTTHEQARDWISARYDGELDTVASRDLDAHLEVCAPCSAFAELLPRLHDLAVALPREPDPARLVPRVTHRIRTARRRRIVWRLAPTLGVVTAITLVLTVLPGPASFPLPAAAAAEPLLRLRSLYVERQITETRSDGTRSVTRERVWFRAPGSVRVEREISDATGTREEVDIRVPGARYENGTVTTGLAPEAALPEPLSPTLTLLGRDTGPGPEVAGRSTRRYELVVGGQRRVALVDSDAPTVLDGTDSVVLGKVVLEKVPDASGQMLTATVVKRTLAIRYNGPVADRLFAIPGNVPTSRLGFRPVAEASLSARPRHLPRGFRLVSAVRRGQEEQALLYARGAMPILITTDTAGGSPDVGSQQIVRIGARSGLLLLDLYDLPRLRFSHHGQVITVAAALPPTALAELVNQMYPDEPE